MSGSEISLSPNVLYQECPSFRPFYVRHPGHDRRQFFNMHETYETWLDRVRAALNSINMPMEDWQQSWPFDFSPHI